MSNPEKQEIATRREQADYIVKRLTDFGVRIHAVSRIGIAQRVLNRPETIEHDDPEYEIALESMHDNYQLRLIVDTMDAHRESKAFKDALYYLRKDKELPQDELKDTPGRNYQFQLYVAALCTNTRLMTRHEEPDVTCVIEGQIFGIAAKRLRTMDSLEANVKEAAKQISCTAFPGIIALDLTVAWNPTNRRVTSTIESQLYSYLSDARSRDLFQQHGDRIRELVEGKKVLGVWIYASTIRLMPDGDWSHDCWSFWFDTTQNKDEDALFETFQRGFLKGVPNLIDLNETDE